MSNVFGSNTDDSAAVYITNEGSNGCETVYVKNFFCMGALNSPHDDDHPAPLVGVSAGEYIILRNGHCEYSQATGISLHATKGVCMRNITITNCNNEEHTTTSAQSLVRATGGSSNLTLKNFVIWEDDGLAEWGVYLAAGVSKIHISNSIVHDVDTNGVQVADSAVAVGININNCIVHSNAGYGVYGGSFTAATPYEQINVGESIVRDNTGHGIHIYWNPRAGVILGNCIYGNDANIVLRRKVQDYVICFNNIFEGDSYGLQEIPNVDTPTTPGLFILSVIYGNRFADNGTSAITSLPGEYGIRQGMGQEAWWDMDMILMYNDSGASSTAWGIANTYTVNNIDGYTISGAGALPNNIIGAPISSVSAGNYNYVVTQGVVIGDVESGGVSVGDLMGQGSGTGVWGVTSGTPAKALALETSTTTGKIKIINNLPLIP